MVGIIKDEFLNNVAQVISESDNTIRWVAVSEEEQTLGTSGGTFVGEEGDRVQLSSSRVNNFVTFAGLREGSQVPEGESRVFQSAGFFLDETGGTNKIVVNLPSIEQTNNFDVQHIFTLGVFRNE